MLLIMPMYIGNAAALEPDNWQIEHQYFKACKYCTSKCNMFFTGMSHFLEIQKGKNST